MAAVSRKIRAVLIYFRNLRGANMKAIRLTIEILRGARWPTCAVAVLLLTVAFSLAAQAPKSGIVRPLSGVKFPAGEGPDCLQFFLENGDPNTGPTTAIMKAAPKCVVPAHYHSAEEQLIIVKGNVSTGMEGMQDTVLGPGGFAMMPSKAPHWFTCTANEECLMFVTFDRAYDIVWIKPKN
jgi:quercetin dioxygenase-like cupin family protein